MGKPDQRHGGISASAADAHGPGVLRSCAAGIAQAFSPRCVLVLVLGFCALLSAVFWLPPFGFQRSRFVPDDEGFSADIQASFVLERPLPDLIAYVDRLEYDIFEEIGVPNSKVSIMLMQSSALKDSTYVTFGVLPDSKNVPISTPALSVLKSSLVALALKELNLSLTLSLFGHSSSLELLKFPGGITVIPEQTAFIWKTSQGLFSFTLNNSISQIWKNLDEFKNQLKLGLDLRNYENVYVEIINTNGSTVACAVIVQALVLSDFGSRSLLPDRLKQLAEVITGPNAKNLGLDHSIFGKVKGVQLSSYFEHSISSPSPSPSPSASPSPSPSPSLSPSPSPSPSTSPCPYSSSAPANQHHQASCLYCDIISPSESPLSDTLPPQSSSSTESPVIVAASPSLHPNVSPRYRLNPPSIPPQPNAFGPSSKMSPAFPPFLPPPGYGSLQIKGTRKFLVPILPKPH